MYLLRYINLFCKIWALDIQAQIEYKFDFFIGNLATILGQVVGIVFVWIIMKRIGNLSDWNFAEVMLIYAFSAIPYGLSQLLFNGFWRLTAYVKSGDFDFFLVRPLGALFLILSDQAATHGIGTIATGIVILVKAASDLNIKCNLLNIAVFMLMIICGTIIHISINMLSSSISFWFVGVKGSVMFVVQQFRDFANYPISIYSIPLQIILTWILPFALTSFYPVAYLLGKQGYFVFVYIIPLVSLGFLGISYCIWYIGLSKYQSTGS